MKLTTQSWPKSTRLLESLTMTLVIALTLGTFVAIGLDIATGYNDAQILKELAQFRASQQGATLTAHSALRKS